nr:YkvA family protein [uncultured Desulfuromonas sp.]
MASKSDLSSLLRLKRRILEYVAVVRSPQTPVHVKFLAVAAGLYLLMPVDLIPDMIPVLGLTDDAALIGLFLSYLNRFITEDIKRSVDQQDTAKK